MKKNVLRCRWVWAFSVLLLTALLAGVALAENGQAGLDNDFSQDDLETYVEDASLEIGKISVRDEDGDGDFDHIQVGTKGGGSIFGWAEFDGQAESELIVSAPALEAGLIQQADADADDDMDVLWVGTQGTDWNHDGSIGVEESGRVVAIGDFDGDGDVEVLATDTTQVLGEVRAKAFELDKTTMDALDVLWVGVGNALLNGRAAAVEKLANIDGDKDIEVILKDNRSRSNGEPRFGQVIDMDDDGDPDIVIE